jgi:hypothetical protein
LIGNRQKRSAYTPEEITVFFRVTTRSQDLKDCSLIYRIEGVLDIKIQHYRDSTTTSRLLDKALQFGESFLEG